MFKRHYARGAIAAAILGAAIPGATASAQSPDNVCRHPVVRAHVVQCRQAAPFLGRWTSIRYGGELEVVMMPDGTLTAIIVSGNRVMRENGYGPGTHVLRGWRPKATGGTWQASAANGESFSAIKPGRRPGEIFGDAAWGRLGVLYIAKAHPNQLGMPATLESRISNYDPWVRRVDTASR